MAQLRLVQAMQEIALVLARIAGLEQLEQSVHLAHLGVMAGRDGVRPQLHGVVEKGLELDLGIAQDVGVGRAPGLVFAQEFAEHAFLVFLGEIDRFDRDADGVGDRHRVEQILARRAIFVVVVVLPVLHEQADHVVSLLLEQQGGDGRIHAAGHANHDARFRIDFHVCSFSRLRRGRASRGGFG